MWFFKKRENKNDSSSSPQVDADAPLADASTAADENPSEDAEPPIPPELVQAFAALEAEDYELANKLAFVHIDSNNKQLWCDARRICAMAKARLGQWDVSFASWLSLFEWAEPTAHNALQLATVSIKCGEIERGKAWFEKMLQLQEEEPDARVEIPRAYAHFLDTLASVGHVQEALPYLDWLKGLYEHLSITDSHYLYMRGVPFFSVFLEKGLEIVKAAMPPDQAKAWFSSMLTHLDGPGQEALNEMLHREF